MKQSQFCRDPDGAIRFVPHDGGWLPLVEEIEEEEEKEEEPEEELVSHDEHEEENEEEKEGAEKEELSSRDIDRKEEQEKEEGKEMKNWEDEDEDYSGVDVFLSGQAKEEAEEEELTEEEELVSSSDPEDYIGDDIFPEDYGHRDPQPKRKDNDADDGDDHGNHEPPPKRFRGRGCYWSSR